MSTLNVDKVDPSTGTALEIGSSGDTITIPSGATIVNSGTATGFSTVAWQSVVTATTLTAVAGRSYPINTTSNACAVTLPAGSVGDVVEFVDYAGTWDTNNVTLSADGTEKIKGVTTQHKLVFERQGVRLAYVDATQGWVGVTGLNETNPAVALDQYNINYLVIAGGGGAGYDLSGAGGAGGYRSAYNSESSGGGAASETAFIAVTGTVYTTTVGAGGTGAASAGAGTNGVDSSISGTGLTTITSAGGGEGGGAGHDPVIGGSGGGADQDTGSTGTGAAGTANQGYAGGNSPSASQRSAGGGGATAVGQDQQTSNGGYGGAGQTSTINGSVQRAGGGGGGAFTASTGGVGGAGGGGDGNEGSGQAGEAGTVNTGGGGGGGSGGSGSGGAGGSGVVILRMPDGDYTGTTTGSPTVTTGVGGTDTTLLFNSTGSYTA